MYYIYELRHWGHVFYVGQTVAPNKRYKEHISSRNKKCSPVSRFVYDLFYIGEAPEMVIVSVFVDKHLADTEEVRLMNIHKCWCNTVGMRIGLHKYPETIKLPIDKTFEKAAKKRARAQGERLMDQLSGELKKPA